MGGIRRVPFVRRRCLAGVIALVAIGLPAHATDTQQISPVERKIEPLAPAEGGGKYTLGANPKVAAQATFQFRALGFRDDDTLSLAATDLVGRAGRVLAGEISFSTKPANGVTRGQVVLSVKEGHHQVYSVVAKVNPQNVAGNYSGRLLFIAADSTIVHEHPLELEIYQEVPVETDLSDVRLATAGDDDEQIVHVRTKLPNTGVRILEPKVLTLRRPDGEDLAPSAVVIGGQSAEWPKWAASGDPAQIVVRAVGGQAKPGAYKGKMIIPIEAQAPLEVEVYVLSKAGYSWPLAVLLAGLAVGFALSWWGAEGQKISQLIRSVQRTLRILNEPSHRQGLMGDDRNEAKRLLGVVTEHLNDRLLDLATTAYGATNAFIAKRREEVAAHRGDVGALADRVAKVPVAKALRQNLAASLREQDTLILEGTFPRLADARARSEALGRQATALEALAAQFSRLSPADQAERLPALDAATTFEEAQTAIEPDSGGATPSVDGEVESVGRSLPTALKVKKSLAWKVNTVSALASLTVAGLAIVVGWQTLYGAVPDFGAEIQHWVSLFLWGGIVETVRGRAVTLSFLQKTIKGA